MFPMVLKILYIEEKKFTITPWSGDSLGIIKMVSDQFRYFRSCRITIR